MASTVGAREKGSGARRNKAWREVAKWVATVHLIAMTDYVKRTLSYVNDHGEIERVADDALDCFDRSLIILGEPGMGKTRLRRAKRLLFPTGRTYRPPRSAADR